MPTTVPEGTLLAPVQLLKLIRWSCESDMPCTKTKTKNILVYCIWHVPVSAYAKEAKNASTCTLSRLK